MGYPDQEYKSDLVMNTKTYSEVYFGYSKQKEQLILTVEITGRGLVTTALNGLDISPDQQYKIL